MRRREMSEKLERTLSYSRAAELATVLEGLAEGLRGGCVKLTGDRRSLLLFPRPVVKLAIRAERSGRKGRLRVKVVWDHGLLVK
jgi:amphi-Trp domain-containing protein